MTTLELDGRPQTVTGSALAPDSEQPATDRPHPSSPALSVAGLTVVPVLDGVRPLGVYVVTDRARWYPVSRPSGWAVLVPAVATAAAAAVAVLVTSRRAPGRRRNGRGLRPRRGARGRR